MATTLRVGVGVVAAAAAAVRRSGGSATPHLSGSRQTVKDRDRQTDRHAGGRRVSSSLSQPWRYHHGDLRICGRVAVGVGERCLAWQTLEWVKTHILTYTISPPSCIMDFFSPPLLCSPLPSCRWESQGIFRRVFLFSLCLHITRHSQLLIDFGERDLSLLPFSFPSLCLFPDFPLRISPPQISPPSVVLSPTIPVLFLFILSAPGTLQSLQRPFLSVHSSPAFLSPSSAFIFPVPCRGS